MRSFRRGRFVRFADCDWNRRAALHRPGASPSSGDGGPTPDGGATGAAGQWFGVLFMVAVLLLLAAVLASG